MLRLPGNGSWFLPPTFSQRPRTGGEDKGPAGGEGGMEGEENVGGDKGAEEDVWDSKEAITGEIILS